MRTLQKYSSVILLLLASRYGAAQDFHLSQYDAAPQYFNPALTGMYFDAPVPRRINANFRSQWKSVAGKPYTTVTAGYDQPYKRFGLGGFAVNNRAGNGGFNTLSILLSGAYQILEDPMHRHSLSTGLQLGVLQRSIDPDKLWFDSQYSPSSAEGFDPLIASGETFNKTSLLRLDGNIGIYYKRYAPEKKTNPHAGFAVYHATYPNISFTSYKSHMPLHYILNGGLTIRASEKLTLSPEAIAMKQSRAFELSVGAMGYYGMDQYKKNTVLFGAYYRWEDAVAIHAGFKQGHNVYRISYDINTSSLSSFSGHRGALELSVVYCGNTKK